MKPPIAKKHKYEITQHGQTRNDEYSWLRDENWKNFISGDLSFKDPEILKYIEDENQYKDHIMSSQKEVKDTFYQEILSRIKEDDQSFQTKKGDYFYYTREEKGKDYTIYCRKHLNMDSSEEIYMDINHEAKDKDLFIYGPEENTEDNKYLAYFYNLTGSMEKTLKIRDLSTMKDLEWEINDCTGSFAWCDNENLYYIKRDASSRGKEVYKLNIHEGPQSQKLVFEKPEKYEDMFIGIDISTNEEYFFIYLESGSTHVAFASKKGTDTFQEIAKGENDISFSFEHFDNHFYVLTNNDNVNEFKVKKFPEAPSKWDSQNWQDYITPEPSTEITDIHIYNQYLVMVIKNNNLALEEIVVKNLKTQETKKSPMAGEAYSLSFSGDWDFNSTKVRLWLSTPINSYQAYELDLETNSQTLQFTEQTPHFDSSKYECIRRMAPSRDGKEIPVTLTYKKGIKLDGSHPAFVYSYGSYGYSMNSDFSSSKFSLIDRGFVHCIPHIRGGDDKGHSWYLDGKMQNKMNTFNDFIDCCEYLINEKYTAKKNICIQGGSAGGLLMGAVTNMRPDLFACVIAEVPFVDVINTISDETLPLTPPEWEEWGNPITNKNDFNYMMKYSPYDNVMAQEYPPMLFNSGISDEQVTYWEPTKMVARLRDLKTDENLLLLNMKMHAGHAGASKKYEWIEEYAFNYAFIAKTML
jgi:oligopeptidase B